MASVFNKENNDTEEKALAILVGLDTGRSDNFEHSMEEMESLIEACDMLVAGQIVQHLDHPNAGTYLGKGKIDEVRDFAIDQEADLVIFEDNLSPAQLKNLQQILDIEVWDRTNLILEIFSRRAKTREARLQVEVAYLQYMLPRLTGMWQHLGRQGGGSGSMSNKGVGETQIELDRRHIRKRIGELKRELEDVKKTRDVQRAGRSKGNLPSVALVGYTNAGKSTIMNHLLMRNGAEDEKQVLEKDMLFATLDTSIRHVNVEGNKDFLLSDTVGFIENLPHDLIKAFRSTLEEAANADLLLIVLDASDPNWKLHKKVTEDTLVELGAGDIERIYVMNKADKIDSEAKIPRVREDSIWMSAKKEIGFEELISMITLRVYKDNELVEGIIPYSRGDLINLLHEKANVFTEEYRGDGIFIKADCPKSVAGAVKNAIEKTTLR